MVDRTCQKCNKVFDLPCRLKSHQKRKIPCDLIVLNNTNIILNAIKKDFKCKHCLRTFSTETSMYRHIRKTCKMVNIPNATKDTLIIDIVQKQIEILSNSVNGLLNEKKIETKNNTHNNMKIITFQYIYLIYLREFINSKQNIYKIGKTKQINHKRFSQYPKGSIILYQITCINCDKAEKDLISLFKSNYEHCKNIGNEYFKGNYRIMINDINTYIFNSEADINNSEADINNSEANINNSEADINNSEADNNIEIKNNILTI
jgi:hypothetical protein